MDYHFEYDFYKDAPKPSQLDIIGFSAMGVVLILQGIAQIYSNLDVENGSSLLFYSGIFILISGAVCLLYGVRGGKPIFLQGENYIRIEDGVLYSKLKKNTEEKVIPLKEIKKVEMTGRAVILFLQNKEEVWIYTNRILNADKKKDFRDFFRGFF